MRVAFKRLAQLFTVKKNDKKLKEAKFFCVCFKGTTFLYK